MRWLIALLVTLTPVITSTSQLRHAKALPSVVKDLVDIVNTYNSAVYALDKVLIESKEVDTVSTIISLQKHMKHVEDNVQYKYQAHFTHNYSFLQGEISLIIPCGYDGYGIEEVIFIGNDGNYYLTEYGSLYKINPGSKYTTTDSHECKFKLLKDGRIEVINE